MSNAPVPSYSQKQELNARLSSLDIELRGVDEDLKKLKELRAKLFKERDGVLKELEGGKGGQGCASGSGRGQTKLNGLAAGTGKTNYMTERFEWAGELKRRMKEVFSIDAFRLCQEG